MKIYQYEVEFDRDIKSNYMVLKTKSKHYNDKHFESQMLLNNRIDMLLPVDLRGQDDEVRLYYDITSKQPLEELLVHKEMKLNQLKMLLEGLFQVVEKTDKYLLTEDNFVLAKEFIYIEPTRWEPCFLYVPQGEDKISLTEQLKELSDYIMIKVLQEDQEAVRLAHQFYKITRQRCFSCMDIKKLIDQEPEEGSLNQIKDLEVEEKETNPQGVLGEAKPKNKTMDMPMNKEKVMEEKEVQVYGLPNKIGAGILQGAVVGLLSLVIKYRVFEEEITGKLNVSKLIVFFIVILAIDAYCLIKILDPSKKVIKIIQEEKWVAIQPKLEKPYLNLNKKTIHNDLIEEKFVNLEGIKKDQVEGTTLLASDEATAVLAGGSSINRGILIRITEGITEEITLYRTPFNIGKMKEQVDYVIHNPTVSRLHAKIIREQEAFYLVDLNSRNGTFLNEERIVSQEKYLLKNGDSIRFSNSLFTFRQEGEL